jgi:predicted MFS family arabinose efflux permease
MQIVLILVLVLLVRVAQYVGLLYGWQYHALILVALGVGVGALFRLAAPKMPEPLPQLPPADDPEGKKIREFIASAEKDLKHSVPALRRDAMLIPILACVPAALVLLILQQQSYLPEFSLWFRLSFVPVLIYVFVRYILPQRRKVGA